MKQLNLRDYRHIIMIGMPGSGKSTIGNLLSKEIQWQFIDADDLITNQTGKTLQEIINNQGLEAFTQIEEDILCKLHYPKHIISPGGSAVYYTKAMQIFKQNSLLIYLDVSFRELQKRISNFETRGIAIKKGQTFYDLFLERQPLYEKYADLIIECDNRNEKQVIEQILNNLCSDNL